MQIFGVKVTADTTEADKFVSKVEGMTKATTEFDSKAGKGFKSVEGAMGRTASAATATTSKWNSHTTAMNGNVSAALNLTRSLGPLGDAGARLGNTFTELGSKLGGIGVQIERARAAQSGLDDAFSKGQISAATLGAVHDRVASAQTKATATSRNLYSAEQIASAARSQQVITAARYADQLLKVAAAEEKAKVAQAFFSANVGNAATRVPFETVGVAQGVVTDEKSRLAQLELASASATNVSKSATDKLTQARLANRNAVDEQSAALKLQNQTQAAGTASMLGTVAVIGGIVVALVSLAAAYIAVKKAIEFVKAAIAEAAASQTQAFEFSALIEDAGVARERFQELADFWKSSGVFKFEGLVEASRQLTLLGIGTQNLIPLTEALAAASLASGTSLQQMTTAYGQVQEAIRNRTKLATYGINGTTAVMTALKRETGLTTEEIQAKFKAGTLSIETVKKALLDAAAAGGVFGNAIADKGATWEGQIARLTAAWETFKEAFGAPVLEVLSPILERVIEKLLGAENLAHRLGTAFAGMITDLDEAIKQGRAWEIFELNMKIAIDRIVIYAQENLKDLIPTPIADKFAATKKELISIDALIKGIAEFNANPTGAPFLEVVAKHYREIKAETEGSSKATQQLNVHMAELAAVVDDVRRSADFALELDTEDAKKKLDELWKPLGISEQGETAAQLFVSSALARLAESKGAFLSTLQGLFDVSAIKLDLATPEPFNLATGVSGTNLFSGIAAGASTAGTAGPPIFTGGVGTKDADVVAKAPKVGGGGGGGSSKVTDDYKSDLDIINDYWYQVQLIESSLTTDVEKHRREMDLALKTSGELYDPGQFAPYVSGLGDQLDAMRRLIATESERKRAAAETDLQIQLGAATTTKAILRGLQKQKEAYGNMQVQVVKATGQIYDSLVGGISSGLSDILDGTKSVGQGFKDMAVSILKDIQRIIIKLLVELAIQTLLGMVGGGSAKGSYQIASGSVPRATPVGHTGMIVGGTAPQTRMMDLAAFNGAPRYHNGGILPGEQPIIAKKGEGIFTPEQMSNLAPVSSKGPVSINMPITINKTTESKAGDGDEDDDAKQTRMFITRVKAIAKETFIDESRHGGAAYQARYGR